MPTNAFQRSARLLRYYRLLNMAEHDYECYQTDDPSLKKEAQQLQAAVYLARGYVQPHEFGENGILAVEHDPYQDHAHYFVVRNCKTGKVVASSRLIYALPNTSLEEFQLLTHLKIDGAAYDYIKKYSANECVEVSALVKAHMESSLAVLLLYREMWHYSLLKGYRVWLIACNANLYANLEKLFGEALTKAGPVQVYRHHEFVPATMELSASVSNLMQSTNTRNPIKRAVMRQLVRFFLRDIPHEVLSASQAKQVSSMLR